MIEGKALEAAGGMEQLEHGTAEKRKGNERYM